MNKKKLIAMLACMLLIVAIAVGGTLAYFNDTDSKTNVFTFGNIDIELEEDFPEDELMPGENNALVKKVTVKNVGPNDAYMWAEMWIPAELNDLVNAATSDLHMVFGEGTKVVQLTAKYYGEDEDAVLYNGYRVYIENDTAKAKDVSTAALLEKVYMDKDIKLCTISDHEEGCLVLKDEKTHYTGSWEIIVNAYGMQAAGFETIEEAIDAYDGEKL